ncbi:hypothetical protein BDC45DRAFT_574309 [Circinella umbellata]|nr:hypothetical protein BDC45DRAFT_574309 [Circinella umbellata]
MPRNTPCKGCRKRQKGCFWPSNSNICVRCAKYNVDCIVVSRSKNGKQDEREFNDAGDSNNSDGCYDDLMPKEYVENSLEKWRYQVQQLEIEIANAEKAIRYYRHLYKEKNSNNNSDPGSNGYRIKQREQKHMEWKLTVENGLLKLHTSINTMEELLIYNRASLRYLSPFQALFKRSNPSASTTTIKFANSIFSTVILRAFRFLFAQAVHNPPDQKNCVLVADDPYDDELVNNYPNITAANINVSALLSSPLQLPSVVPSNIREIIDQLVRIYIEHKNPTHAFLHTSSFIEYYNSPTTNPLMCPVTLALCTDTICTTRRLDENMFPSTKRQYLAQFFYQRCKGFLADMFDDPYRRLETIITISFLKHYILFVRLRPLEARRLITISYLLCKDLNEEKEHHQSYLSNGGGKGGIDKVILKRLAERHLLHTESMLNMVSFISNETIFKPQPTVTYLEKLPGEENDIVGFYIDINNRLIELSNNFYMRIVTGNERLDKKVDTLSMETLFQCDEIIKDWWENMPPHLRITNNLFDTNVKLRAENDWIKAIVFCFAHVNIMRVHICLLKPVIFRNDEQDNDNEDTHNNQGTKNIDDYVNPELLESIREQAKETVLRSCDILLDTMVQMLTSPTDLPSAITFELVSRVMHVLVTVTGPNVPVSIHRKFYRCIQAIHALFPSDTVTVPPSRSPLNAIVTSQQHLVTDFDDCFTPC